MEGPCSSLGMDEGLLDIPRHDFEGALYSLEGLWEESRLEFRLCGLRKRTGLDNLECMGGTLSPT